MFLEPKSYGRDLRQEIMQSSNSKSENVETMRDNSEKPSARSNLEKPSYFTPRDGEDELVTVEKILVKVVENDEGKVADVVNIFFLFRQKKSEEAYSKVERSLEEEISGSINYENVDENEVESIAEVKSVKAEKDIMSYAFSKNDVKHCIITPRVGEVVLDLGEIEL